MVASSQKQTLTALILNPEFSREQLKIVLKVILVCHEVRCDAADTLASSCVNHYAR